MASNRLVSTKVGDRVTVRFGGHDVTAEIIEDQGPIGAGGRHLFAIAIPMEPYEPLVTVAAEEELGPYRPPVPLKKPQILEFLSNGGLEAILYRYTWDESSPRVWLRRGNAGGVTFTNRRSLGEKGGAEVPSQALRGERIREEKADEIIDFLESFGLTREEAESVVQQVGTKA